MVNNHGQPVEKLVELKTAFEIPFRKVRTVGFEQTLSPRLNP